MIVDEQVLANVDDGQEEPVGVTWNVNGDPQYAPELEMGNWAGASPTTAYRMQLDVPKGAIISVAYMSFRCYYSTSNMNVYLRILADAVDNCPVWGASPNLPSQRTPTEAQIDWDMINVTWIEGNWYDSVSIVDVVQEIVNRPGWSPDNYIGLIIRDDGSSSTHGVWGTDYSADSSWGTKLHVEYSVVGGSSKVVKVIGGL